MDYMQDLKRFAKFFDHTLLKPTASENEIIELCKEANNYGFASVCVNLCQAALAKKHLAEGVKLCSVIDFPFGSSTAESRLYQVQNAHTLKVDEVDIVVAVGDLLESKVSSCVNDLKPVVDFAHDHNMLVKVIVETCYLDEKHIELACEVVESAKADYIKTSTGYGTRGASFEDIVLFKRYLNLETKIKASGGIKTLEEVQKYLSLGCERIGTSRAVAIINEAYSKNLIAK